MTPIYHKIKSSQIKIGLQYWVSNQSWLHSMERSRVDHKSSACEDVILWKIKMTFVLGWWGWDGGCPVV